MTCAAGIQSPFGYYKNWVDWVHYLLWLQIEQTMRIRVIIFLHLAIKFIFDFGWKCLQNVMLNLTYLHQFHQRTETRAKQMGSFTIFIDLTLNHIIYSRINII